MIRHQVKATLTLASLAELAEVTGQWSGEIHGPVRISARVSTPSASAASTIARQWALLGGGRTVAIEIRGLLRYTLETYGRRRWWWSR